MVAVPSGEGMPLPHDPILSIVIANERWCDKELDDKCCCTYTFGQCDSISWPEVRNARIAKVSYNKEAVVKAFNMINMLHPDFVNMHNRFNFDMRCLIAPCVMHPVVSRSFSERRLGNVGIGIRWKSNEAMIVHQVYTATSQPTNN